jgi:hypothetical protein
MARLAAGTENLLPREITRQPMIVMADIHQLNICLGATAKLQLGFLLNFAAAASNSSREGGANDDARRDRSRRTSW